MATGAEQRVAAYAMQPNAEKALFAAAALDTFRWPWQLEWLLVPMVLLRFDKAWRYAAIATLGMLAGAVGTYVLGWLLGAVLGDGEVYSRFARWAESYDVVVVLAAGFSPLPFVVVALGGGFFGTSVPQFIVATLIARGARAFALAWLAWRGGPPMAAWMRQWFYAISLTVSLGLLLGLCLLKFVATYGG